MSKSTDRVELILDAKAAIAEGPVWHMGRQTLFWVDILANQLHEFEPVSRVDRVHDVGQMIGCVVPRKRGGLLLALHHGIARFDLRTGRVQMISRPDHRPGNRFNDGKCDPAGRFWAGSMSVHLRAGQGTLFCIDRDWTVRRMVPKVTISNGLAWSLDASTMYFVDSALQVVSAFDYEKATGRIGNRRAAIRIPKRDGSPDGITLDAEGMLWVAHWGGNRVTRWNPATGRLLKTLRLPVSQVASCAFGGKDLDQLFITTARDGLTPRQLAREPLAGGLFHARPGVVGLAPDLFGG